MKVCPKIKIPFKRKEKVIRSENMQRLYILNHPIYIVFSQTITNKKFLIIA